jgi:ABC-type multidrug transport system fused ATPase/permease subunit
MKIIKWVWKDWSNEYIIRKSRWLLFLYILKLSFLFLLSFLLIYFNIKLKDYIWIDSPDKLFIVNFMWILLWIFLVYASIKWVLYFIIFFYELEIICKDKIYKLNIWIFRKDDISVVNLLNIQEVKSITEWFFRTLFQISDIELVEQRDEIKVIHFVDDWKEIVKLITELKSKINNTNFENEKPNQLD